MVYRVGVPVVSFGNLTAGGTGKTPAVIERAEQEAAAGRKVAVLTRGYGSRRTIEPLVLMPGEPDSEPAARFGDEPALIRYRVPEAMLVKCADRAAGAREAVARGAEILLLDDGFQSVYLHRDEDIVLLDAQHPFSNGQLIPRGLLREPPAALRRATQLWLTRCDACDHLEATIGQVRQVAPDTPLRLTQHVPTALRRLDEPGDTDLSYLEGREVIAACGIAQPSAFTDTLAGLGAVVSQTIAVADHQRLSLEQAPQALPIVVTEKDAVKLDTPKRECYALAVSIRDFQAR